MSKYIPREACVDPVVSKAHEIIVKRRENGEVDNVSSVDVIAYIYYAAFIVAAVIAIAAQF